MLTEQRGFLPRKDARDDDKKPRQDGEGGIPDIPHHFSARLIHDPHSFLFPTQILKERGYLIKERGVIQVKDMARSEQHELPLDGDLPGEIARLLANDPEEA